MMSPITKSIIKRELKQYFLSPMGYIFVIIFLFALGYVAFEPGSGGFFINGQADLSSLFRYIPWIFVFLVPAISMKLWSEERKTGTIELLFTLPVTVKEAVLGKFMASWIFLIFALAGTFPMIITVVYLGNPDPAGIIFGYLGSALLGGAMLSVGSFFSALTKNHVVSFILSIGICYVFIMAGSPPILEFLDTVFPRFVVDVFESLSMLNHFEALGRGVVQLGDLCFYSIMIAGFLYANVLLLSEKMAD